MRTGSTVPLATLSIARAGVNMGKIGQVWKASEGSSDKIWSLPTPSYIPLTENVRGLLSGNNHFLRSIRKYNLPDV